MKGEHGDVGISMVNEANHLYGGFPRTARAGRVSGATERVRGGRADVFAFFVLIKSAISRSRERFGSWREGSHARSSAQRQRARRTKPRERAHRCTPAAFPSWS